MQEIEEFIVRMANENRWGYLRIRGALANLGYHVARTTIARLPKVAVGRLPHRQHNCALRSLLTSLSGLPGTIVIRAGHRRELLRAV